MSENTNLGFVFDANQVEPNQGISLPIPKGVYTAVIFKSDIKPTSNGTGTFVETQFKVIEGPHAGHIVFHNYNIRNQSQKAMEIGFGQLSSTCRAAGVIQIQDMTQLYNRPMLITLKIGGGGQRPDGGTYDERNEITAWHPMSAGAGISQSPVAPLIPPAASQIQQPAPAPEPWQAQKQAPTQQPWQAPAQEQAQAQQPWQPAQSQTPAGFDPNATAAQPWQQPNTAPAADPNSWQNQNPVVPASAPVPAQAVTSEPTNFVPPWMQNPKQ